VVSPDGKLIGIMSRRDPLSVFLRPLSGSSSVAAGPWSPYRAAQRLWRLPLRRVMLSALAGR
jgi:hypothetical protein